MIPNVLYQHQNLIQLHYTGKTKENRQPNEWLDMAFERYISLTCDVGLLHM